MTEAEQENPMINIIFFVRCVVGLFFLLVGVINLIVGSYLVGLIFAVLSIVLIPSLANKLKTLILGSLESTLDDNPNNKAEHENPMTNIIFFIRCVVGLFFLLAGVIYLIDGSYFIGLIFIVLSIVLIPSLANKLKTLILGSSESTLDDNPNNEAEHENPMTNIIFFVRCVVGLFFLLVGVINLIVGSYFIGLIFIVLSIVLIPSLANKLKTLILGSSESTLDDNPNNKIDTPQEQVCIPKSETNGKQAQQQGGTLKSSSEPTAKPPKTEPTTKQPEYLNRFKGKTDDNKTTNGSHKQMPTSEQAAKSSSTGVMAIKNNISNERAKSTANDVQNDSIEQLLKEIDKVLKNEHKLNYIPGIKTLIVDLNETGIWNVEFLRSEIFEDTLNIIKLVTESQNKIMVVLVNYVTTLPDEYHNYTVKRAYSGRYPMENFHSVDWNDIKKNEREDWLRENADYFWLHTILKND